MLKALAEGQARKEIEEIAADSVTQFCWPLQSLHVGGVLLPKKEIGDTRVVGIIGTFPSVVMRALSPEIREWDRSAVVVGDSSALGRDMVLFVARRALDAEAKPCG